MLLNLRHNAQHREDLVSSVELRNDTMNFIVHKSQASNPTTLSFKKRETTKKKIKLYDICARKDILPST